MSLLSTKIQSPFSRKNSTYPFSRFLFQGETESHTVNGSFRLKIQYVNKKIAKYHSSLCPIRAKTAQKGQARTRMEGDLAPSIQGIKQAF
jgi:hypothetical protein